jgi:regulation of enolase protein 1 (concanavalin A-like superfamily)
LLTVKASAEVPQSFSIYSLEETNVFDRASLNCGNIGSNKKVTIGSEAPIRGSIFAGTTVTLKDRASVNGNVTAGGLIVKGSGVYISGTQSPNTPVTTYTIPTITVTPGSQNVDVAINGLRTLDPGAYGTILVRDRATLRLNAGTFQFRSLSLGNDAHLVLNFAASQSITINVANDVVFLDRVIFEYANNPDFSKVKIYSGTTNTVKLGYDMRFAAFLSVPRAKIEISDRVNFQGAIYGKYVDVKYDTKNELQVPTGEGVIAVVKKVINNGDGTYTVQFGYVNNGSKIVVVPVGVNNYMTGLPGGNQNGGQVTTFYPGQVELSFSVVTDFAGSGSIGWVLYGGDQNYTTSVDADPTMEVRTDLAVIPSVNKIISNCDGTYTAFFGYTSLNSVIVRVDVGSSNYFTGTPSANAGQPNLYKTGTHESVFSVTFSGSSIEWNLQGTSIIANASDALISCLNVQPVLTAVVENCDGSVKAVFGYNNPNEIVVNRPVTGTNNFIAGAYGNDVGQPTTLAIGSVPEAFSVNFSGPLVSWTLDGVTVTALKSAAVDRDFGMWSSSNIGGVSGNYTLKGSRMTLSVTGSSGTPTNDKLYFVNYQTSTNFEIKTKVSPTAVSVQKVGLMIRGNTSDNAEYIALKINNTGSIVLESRAVAGTAYSTTTVGSAITNPWIRIIRNGSVFNTYISADGTTWTSAGSQTIAMSINLYLGLTMEGNGISTAHRVFKNVDVTFSDNNSNQIPDIVESIIGGSMAGVPRRSHWTNEGLATAVTDDYSSVSGYAYCTAVRSLYSHAEVEGVILPVDQLVDAATAPVPPTSGLIIDGGKLHNITGDVKDFDNVIQAFPISTQLRGVPKELLRLDHYNTITSQWEPVELEQVTTDAAYAKVKSYSYYRLATEYTILSASNSSDLESRLVTAATPLPAGQRYAILCQGSSAGIEYRPSSATSFTAFTIPENVLLLGGLPDPSTVVAGDAFVSDPKKYKSILTVNSASGTKQIVVNMSVNLTGGEQKYMNRTVDGFTIRGGDNLGSAWSAGGVRIAGIGGHVYRDTIRNCVIENNTGTNAGGIIVVNAMEIDIANCIFQNNTQVADATSEAPKDGKKYGGSAILLTLGGSCHCEATVRNCVFLKNTANGPLYASTVTMFGDYAMDGDPTSVPSVTGSNYTDGAIQNCTFYGNSVTSSDLTCAGGIVTKYTTFDRMTVVNSIIRGNTPLNANDKLRNGQITYCNIGDAAVQPVTSGTPNATTHNFNEDPLFIKTTTGYAAADLALKYASVCKNTGTNLDNNAVDIRGYQRRENLYDMGAYENYIKVLPVGDGNTVGYGGIAYRAYLKQLMINNDVEVDFIGASKARPYNVTDPAALGWATVTDGPTSTLLKDVDQEHDGDYSNTVDNLIGATTANPNPTQTAVNSTVATYLNNAARVDFDVLLLAVGKENLYMSTGAASGVNNKLKQLISGINSWIVSTAPTTSLHKVVVSTVTPFGTNSDPVACGLLNDKVDALNVYINTAGNFGATVDKIAVMDNTTLASDEVIGLGEEDDNGIIRYFNNSAGCTSIANSFWTAIQDVLP